MIRGVEGGVKRERGCGKEGQRSSDSTDIIAVLAVPVRHGNRYQNRVDRRTEYLGCRARTLTRGFGGPVNGKFSSIQR